AIGLADVLIASGQETRGRFLLTTIIARMRHERDELAVPEFWYYRWHPTALALNGEHDAALAMMQRAVASGLGPGDWWYYYESEPAYAALRRDPGFQATLETVRTRVEAQRDDLERMRRDRLVPDRG
ncbi:MAG: hypothetical protein K0R70_2487, partial [Steroidobacteraceae bacterium]|nr:hypothetical protein [Steroidobacteraceae bacterium]